MVIRFRIGTLLIITALVALFMGFFAPELRSWDRNTRLFFTGIGIITAVALVELHPGLGRAAPPPQAVTPRAEDQSLRLCRHGRRLPLGTGDLRRHRLRHPMDGRPLSRRDRRSAPSPIPDRFRYISGCPFVREDSLVPPPSP